MRGRAALIRLLEAYQCANELQRDVWEFAVELEELQRVGCTNSEVRWLVCKGLITHAREVVSPNRAERAFQRCDGLVFGKRTCFTLTEAGVPVATGLHTRDAQLAHTLAVGPAATGSLAAATLTPRWDDDCQELRLGHLVVKRFKVPAANQQRILSAFEEEGWPVRIDDPLPPQADQLPKRRLHDTINSLNRNQVRPLLRFLGDGRGEGIRWQLVHAELEEEIGRRNRMWGEI